MTEPLTPPVVEPLIFYAALAGFFAVGIDLVLFDILLATCPPKNQTTYVGIHQSTNNMAIFFAPLVGTFLADRIGIAPALVLAAGMRLAGFAMFYWLRVGIEGGQAARAREVARRRRLIRVVPSPPSPDEKEAPDDGLRTRPDDAPSRSK